MFCVRIVWKNIEKKQKIAWLLDKMNEEEDFWYNDEIETLTIAMLKAKQAFNEYINEEEGLDGSYFELEMAGYVLDAYDLERMREVKIDFRYEGNEDEKKRD